MADPDYVVKQHDTWPPLTYRLTDAIREIASISKSGSTVTVITTKKHPYSTGDYVYIDDTSAYSDDVARSITVTGARTFTYADADGTVKASETDGFVARGVDLTTATAIRLLMRSNTVLVTGTTTKDSTQTTNRGQGSYTWAAGDTGTKGDYELEFETNWGAGKIQTFPSDGYLTVTIVDDLDEVG